MKLKSTKPLLYTIIFFAISFMHTVAIASTETIKLKIGTLPVADSLLLYAAHNEGFFKKHGLEVEIILFQSALELGSAMRAKALDGHFADIINVLLQNETGAPQKIVATTSFANRNQRHFAIIASPKLENTTIENLKGKKIAIGKDTIVDFLQARISLAHGLEKDYFQQEDIRAIPMRLQLLMAGEIDLALLPEPLVTTLESQGAKVFFDDKNLSESLAVIALRTDVIDKNEILVEDFRAALLEAAHHINAPENTEAYKNIMVEVGLLSPKVIDEYTLLQFNTELLPYHVPTEEELDTYIHWTKEQGILKKSPTYENVIWVK